MAADRPLSALLLAAALLAAPAAAACDAMASTLGTCPEMERPQPMDSGCHTSEPEPESAMSCCFTDADTEQAVSTSPVPQLPSSPLEAGSAAAVTDAPEHAGTGTGEQLCNRGCQALFAPLLL